MAPGKISNRVVVERMDWINNMIKEIGQLPLEDYDRFTSDKRNVWAAESCLRRTLEALMDLGRHILAKGFGRGVSEYKEIASGLSKEGALNPHECGTFKTLAGYRNRMVRFYQEISHKELFEICSSQLTEIAGIVEAIKTWINAHQDLVDKTL